MRLFLTYFFLIILYFQSFSNQPNAKEFYIINDLHIDSLQPQDKALIDSLLSLYYQTNQDTLKLQYIDGIVENCYDDNVWPKYNDLLISLCYKFLNNNPNPKEKINIKSYLSIGLNNKAYFYQQFGDIKNGLKYFMKSLKISEEIGDLRGQAQTLNNIAILMKQSGESQEEMVDYHRKALRLFQQANEKKGESSTYVHIGYYYFSINKLDSAVFYMKKGLEMKKEINDWRGIGNICYNLAGIYLKKGNIDESINYQKQSLEYFNQLNDLRGIAYAKYGIGNAYLYKVKAAHNEGDLNSEKKYLQLAEKYALESKALSQKLKYPKNIIQSTELLFKIYEYKKEWEKAFYELYTFHTYSDSINNESTQKAALEQKLNYEHEKKLLEVKKEQEKIEAIAKAEKKHKNFIIGSISFVLLIVVIFSFFLYRRFQINKRQKLIIETQKHIVEEKNKEIIDSIRYAERIQKALLKSEEHESKHMPEHFILFLPKDIVSGDFYWAIEKQEFLYLAAADCTGHGVPGAFLTMLGTSFLNEITADEQLFSPAEILNRLRDKFIKELSQKSDVDATKDGMDVSLIMLNLKTLELQFAGANNPLWIIRNAELEKLNDESINEYSSFNNQHLKLFEVKPDKQPIGFSYKMHPFTNHSFQLAKNDYITLFTDGYADQFGGPKGKKFKYKSLKELLIQINEKPLREQKKILETTFMQWKGDMEQIDDICLIGLRV